MKIQFGSALGDEAKSNAFITIPGVRGMAAVSYTHLDVYKRQRHHYRRIWVAGRRSYLIYIYVVPVQVYSHL